jgi:hypothetical protein
MPSFAGGVIFRLQYNKFQIHENERGNVKPMKNINWCLRISDLLILPGSS